MPNSPTPEEVAESKRRADIMADVFPELTAYDGPRVLRAGEVGVPIELLRAMLDEADRLRGYLQTDYPKTAGGSLLIPGVTDKERRELLYGTSARSRAYLARLLGDDR